jgi:hypothetical protein
MAEATEAVDAIVVHQGPPALAERIRIKQEEIAVAVEQRRLLAQYVQQCMEKGTDYGVIPGTQKPTLLKPGAEKLVELFRCTPKFALLEKQTDFDRGFFYYRFRVRLYSENAGRVLAEGFGSANSRESRYRWRDGKRKCPSCGSDAALLKSKDKGKGFFCWAKKGGCGETFPENDKRITEQQVGRVENPDIADLDNTVLKMAKKRALVDGAIALARCSDMFTQDVEDFADDAPVVPPPPTTPAEKPTKARKNTPPDSLPPKVQADFAKAQERFKTPTESPGQILPELEPPPPSDKDTPPPADPAAAPGPKPREETHVQFGPHKEKPIIDLLDGDLESSIKMATDMLADTKNARARWRPKAEKNLAALQAERDFRANVMKQEQSQGAQP